MSMRGFDESPVPGRLWVLPFFDEDDDEPEGAKRNAGLPGLLGVGILAGEWGRRVRLGEAVGARV